MKSDHFFENVKKKIEDLFSDKSSNSPTKDILEKKREQVSSKSQKVNKTRTSSKSVKVIYKSEDLPQYSRIIDFKESLGISSNLSESYVVLLSKKHNDVVHIVCDEDKGKLSIDNDFLQIKRKCQELGYRVLRAYSTKNIIKIIYTRRDSKKDSKSSESAGGEYHKLFDAILAKAIKRDSSDIILSIKGGTAKLKMRIKGKVTEVDELPIETASSLASVVYTSIADSGAKDTTFNPKVPQDAIINRRINGDLASVRLATIPSHPNGFDMVLRVMPIGKAKEDHDLGDLGYNNLHVKLIEYASTIPIGVMVIAGVTGSGKTTTLSTLIRKAIKESNKEKRIITIEDPPEHRIEDATQAPVVRSNKDDDEKSPFNAVMRASLRADPDILMPGEIRDFDSASLLVDATLSGHQVYTTVHAPSAFDIVIRLRELGIKGSVLGSSSFLSALIYQSLVRVVCPHCSIDFFTFFNEELKKNNKETKKLIDTKTRLESMFTEEQLMNVRFIQKSGCKHCNNEGVIGREVIAEVVVPDRKMKNLFVEGKDDEARDYYKKAGGKFIVDHGIEKLLDGKVDVRDLEEKVGQIDMSDVSLVDMLKTFDDSLDVETNSIEVEHISLKSEDKVNIDQLKSSLKGKKKESGKIINIPKKDEE